MMQLSNHGEAVIKNFEGLRLQAYRDTAGVWTIGYGSTRYVNGSPVQPGDKLSDEARADELFRHTLGQYESAVNGYVTVPLTQNQFDALVSFTYNTGTSALKSSTLLRKLNAGDYPGAANALLAWNKITDAHTGNKIMSGTLVKRREQERHLFLTA